MDSKQSFIYGIQQIGIGVSDAQAAFKWYAQKLGSDAVIFDDNNTATHMAPYMGGHPHKKRAIMAMNLQGGSGYEIWQFTDRTPRPPEQPVRIGDLGLAVMTVKSKNAEFSCNRLKSESVRMLTELTAAPDGTQCFYISDPYNNIICVKESSDWYSGKKSDLGGTFGCFIGVSDIDRSLKLYSDILGYDQVIFDKTGDFDDLKPLPGGSRKFRRILLTPSRPPKGGFSALFGTSQIELIQALDSAPKKIFANRFWGDLGFIHLCFDTRNLKNLIRECAAQGYPFKVVSNDDFDMGDTAGFWGYLEDDDGTLIEFVEAYKIPLISQIGLNLNLKKRHPLKPLPRWMIAAMALKRVKF